MTDLATPPHPKAPPLVVSRGAFQQLFGQSWTWLLSHYLQIAVATAIATVVVLALIAVRHVAQRLCRRHHTALNHWPQTIGRVITHTRLWFMVMFAAKLVDGYAAPPALVAQTINVLFTVAAAMQAALWAREFVLAVIEARADDEHGALGSAIGIIRLLVTVVVFAIAIVLILDNLGVNVTGLIAGLGVGGIAIGLAAKGIFDDLFSALSIIFDKPFRRGDSIRWDNTNGTVEAIGLKTTRVRAVSGEEVVISNTNLLNKELHNLARLTRRRIVLTLGVAAYTPADVCREIPDMVGAVVEAEPKCKLVRCGLANFGASTLDFELQFDVNSELYDEVFNARHDVLVGILEAFADKHIDLAFPTQVTVAADASGRPASALAELSLGNSPAEPPPNRVVSTEVAPE